MFTIAIAGLGTVGGGVVQLLQQNKDILAARAGQPIVIKAVSARDKKKKRDADLAAFEWVDDPEKLAALPDVQAVVELMGGTEGAARGLAEATLKNGKHFITANKALLATHGVALARLAEKARVHIGYEAAVAGGIPVIKALKEGLAGNRIAAIRGILNGTCNYILTRMHEGELEFADALHEAQQKGFAEADPATDIDGHDTANKLALLTALAFGTEPNLAAIAVEGIRRISPIDLQFADELGCRVKLLGVARKTAVGLEQYVGPSLVPLTSPLAQVTGALNAVLIKGDFAGDLMLQGQGAGSLPTASAVVADIVDVARGHTSPTFGLPTAQLKKLNTTPTERTAHYYMRFQVMDKPGVVADLSAVLRDENISIESLLQWGQSAISSVPVVITTHAADIQAIHRAAAKIAGIATVVEKPCLLSIED